MEFIESLDRLRWESSLDSKWSNYFYWKKPICFNLRLQFNWCIHLRKCIRWIKSIILMDISRSSFNRLRNLKTIMERRWRCYNKASWWQRFYISNKTLCIIWCKHWLTYLELFSSSIKESKCRQSTHKLRYRGVFLDLISSNKICENYWFNLNLTNTF